MLGDVVFVQLAEQSVTDYKTRQHDITLVCNNFSVFVERDVTVVVCEQQQRIFVLCFHSIELFNYFRYIRECHCG